jgi:hypothetical protein
MVDRHNTLAQKFIDRLKPEDRHLIYQMMQEHHIDPNDSFFLALLSLRQEALTLEAVEKLLQEREKELQALYRRIETKCEEFCKRADEFVIESAKLCAEIKVSDNITKHIAGISRLENLRNASSPSPMRFKPFPTLIAAFIAALILVILLTTLILLLLLR